jgi:uncharacterized protein YggT (Ycf19 family)
VSSRPARIVLAIVMNVLIVVAVLDTVRLVVRFFGQLASTSWGHAIVALTNPLVIPFGVHAIKTPYGGVFDVNAALTVGVLLLVEWLVSGLRGRTE